MNALAASPALNALAASLKLAADSLRDASRLADEAYVVARRFDAEFGGHSSSAAGERANRIRLAAIAAHDAFIDAASN